MKKILLGISALALGLAFAGDANAHGPSHGPSRGGRAVVGARPAVYASARAYTRTYYGTRAYHLDNGVRYGGGYYFSGRSHYHWSHRTWCPIHSRYQYYDPYLRAYYYYCPMTLRYLPIPVGVLR